MPAVRRKQDLLWIIQQMEHRLKKVERVDPFDDEDADDLPAPPDPVTTDFLLREHKNDPEFSVIVDWPTTTVNTCQADVDYWVVQLRYTNAAGVPIAELDVGGSPSDYRREKNIKNKGDTNPRAIFHNLARPRTWYVTVRVAIVDKAHRQGPFSDWTDPEQPVDEAQPEPPAPTGLAVTYNVLEKTRWDRIIAAYEFDEVTDWDVPGGNKQNDVRGYFMTVQGGQSASGPWDGGIRRWFIPAKHADADTVVEGVATFKFRNGRYYRWRVKTIDRFNRAGQFGSYVINTPADNADPPDPENVRGYGNINHVGIEWDHPEDPDDDELPHPDVAYYQVQLSLFANFRSVARKDMFVNGQKKEWKTDKYNTKYWLRVRSVDSSGNKGDWIVRGPFKPVKSGSSKGRMGRFADVDWTNEEGVELVSGEVNRIYPFSAAQDMVETLDAGAGNHDGIVQGLVQSSPVTNRTKIGLVFRAIDVNNYMFVQIRKTASNNHIQIRKVVAGVQSLVTTISDPAGIVDGQDYRIMVVMEGDRLTVTINDDELLTDYQMSGGDFSTFGTGHKYGLYADCSGILSDENTRLGDLVYTNPYDEDVVYDFFDRAPASSLGTSDSGDTWTNTGPGTFGIIGQRRTTAILGPAIDPGFLAYIKTGAQSLTVASGAWYESTHAQMTADSESYSFTIDRPVMLFCWAFVQVRQSSAVDFNIRMRITAEADSVKYIGDPTGVYVANNNQERQVSNISKIILPQFGDGISLPATVLMRLEMQHSDGSSRTFEVLDRKLMIGMFYAPTANEEEQFTPLWTTDGAATKKSYFKTI